MVVQKSFFYVLLHFQDILNFNLINTILKNCKKKEKINCKKGNLIDQLYKNYKISNFGYNFKSFDLLQNSFNFLSFLILILVYFK